MKTDNFISRLPDHSPAKGRLTDNRPAKIDTNNPHQDHRIKHKKGQKEADNEEKRREKRSVDGGLGCKAWTGEKLKIQVACMVFRLDGCSFMVAQKENNAVLHLWLRPHELLTLSAILLPERKQNVTKR